MQNSCCLSVADALKSSFNFLLPRFPCD